MTIIRLFLFCVVAIFGAYIPALLGFAKLAAPEKSTASLVVDAAGNPIGSMLIAQKFTSPHYFHSRPSAADYNAMAAVGSNLSPTNPALSERAAEICKEYGATTENPIPADLVTASGSGLDPDISLEGARYQVQRVAKARGLTDEAVSALIDQVSRPLMGTLGGPHLVNVLQLNLALDQLKH